MSQKKIIFALLVSVSLYSGLSRPLGAAPQAGQKFTLTGTVYDIDTKKPITAAAISVVQLKTGCFAKQDGTYSIVLPAGTYTIMVRAEGYVALTATQRIKADTTRNFNLSSKERAGGVTVRGERDIQKISRYTMTADQMKSVPASFNDSISALTSLPNVMRTNGFFGPLVIRGADPYLNGYYIDDIPIYDPMHFGGIHSVINSNLMSEIDLYSSAFPSQFGNAQAAIININTVDEVKKFSGYTDIGLISAAALIKDPINEKYIDETGAEKTRNKGYFIGSGRYGYLSLFIPTFYKLTTGDTISQVPEYYDYQAKGKYIFNNRHSVSFLFMGSRDYFNYSAPDESLNEGADPLMLGASMKYDTRSNSMGFYYNYTPSRTFTNTLMTYGAMNESYQYFNIVNSSAAWAHDINITSKPYIFGVKNKTRFEWWKDHAETRIGLEAAYYYFQTAGKTIAAKTDSTNMLNDQNAVQIIPLGQTIKNETLTGYFENKFTFGGLVLTPGVHAEYFHRLRKTAVDPRGMISFTFPTNTTIAFAGGYYSYFVQLSPMLFNQLPNISAVDYGTYQSSIHRSASIEQKIALFTIRTEGFYNNFWNLGGEDPHFTSDGEYQIYSFNGKLQTYGAELMLRLDQQEGTTNGGFGWVSYTYSRSRYKSGTASTDPVNWNTWVTNNYEQKHMLKLVSGYTYGKHTLSGKFQLYSSTPYTPIIGSYEDLTYAAAHPGKHRIVPVYGEKNSKHYPLNYQLDLRYSYKTSYEWGYVTWYIEVINVLSAEATDSQRWDYRYQYSDSNPKLVSSSSEGLSIIPNFRC